MPLDQPRSDDPDHPGMPPLAGQDQPGSLAQLVRKLPPRRLGSRIDLPLGSPPLAVGPTQLNSDLFGPLLVLGEEQLHPGVGPVEPPRSIDPRRQPKRQIPLVELSRLAFRGLQQRTHPGPARPPHLRQPPPHQRAVLAHQRHHVGDGGKRDEIEVG